MTHDMAAAIVREHLNVGALFEPVIVVWAVCARELETQRTLMGPTLVERVEVILADGPPELWVHRWRAALAKGPLRT